MRPPEKYGSNVIEFPNDLEIVLTRDFEAPLQLVFDVLWKPEHMRNTIAPYGEEVTLLEVDLRVGGDYHYVFVTDDGYECSFRGTFLEVEPPTRSVQTWIFDGWPGVEAVETMELRGGRRRHHDDVAPRLPRPGRPRPHEEVRRRLGELRQRGELLEVAARAGGIRLRVAGIRAGPCARETGRAPDNLRRCIPESRLRSGRS